MTAPFVVKFTGPRGPRGIPGLSGAGERDIRNLGAIEGDDDANIGVNDAAFAAAALTGEVWKVPADGLFIVSKQIVLTSGSGFESTGGRMCEIVMSTDDGHFDCADYNDYNASNKLLFLADTVDDITLLDLMVRLRPPSGGYIRGGFSAGDPGSTIARTARVLEMIDVGGIRNNIRISYRDFRECFAGGSAGWVGIDSCDRGHIDIELNAWDCHPTSDDLGQGQGSVLDIDGNRKNTPFGIGTPTGGVFDGMSSYDIHVFGVRGYNITSQEPWLSGAGGHGGGGGDAHQTDIFNPHHAGTTTTSGFGDNSWQSKIRVDEVIGYGCGDCADVQKQDVWIKRIWATEVHDAAALKILYGASYLRVDEVICDLPKRNVVQVTPANDVPSGPAGRNCHDIIVRKVIGRRVGGLWTADRLDNPGSQAATAIAINNSGDGSNKPYDVFFDDFDVEGGFAIDDPGVQSGESGIASPLIADIGENIYGRGQARNMLGGIRHGNSALHLVDTSQSPKFWDLDNPTKRVRHIVSNVSANTERTVTWPDANVTIIPSSAPPVSPSFTGTVQFNGLIAYGRSAITLVNGLNSDIPAVTRVYIRVVGPTAPFSVGGIVPTGTDGQVLILVSVSGFAMTIVNQDALSDPSNRIITLTGADVPLRAGTSSATLVYDGATSKWTLIATN